MVSQHLFARVVCVSFQNQGLGLQRRSAVYHFRPLRLLKQASWTMSFAQGHQASPPFLLSPQGCSRRWLRSLVSVCNALGFLDFQSCMFSFVFWFFVYVVICFLFEAREKKEKLYLWGMETEEDGAGGALGGQGRGRDALWASLLCWNLVFVSLPFLV